MRLKRVSKNVKANTHRPKPEMIYKDVECELNASLKEVKNSRTEQKLANGKRLKTLYRN